MVGERTIHGDRVAQTLSSTASCAVPAKYKPPRRGPLARRACPET